jgi:ATP-dependent DNA helicase DinG
VNLDLLGLRSSLRAAVPAYEDRPQQQQMAAAVAAALAGDYPLLVEAGTGTGKTLAYLLPALASGKRVVVSTGTKTLQDQIAHQDLPRLRAAVPTRFRAVVVKGIANYLCLRRLHEARGLFASPELEVVQRWAAATTTGDRSEVEALGENAPIWGQVTTTAEGRLGPRCPHYSQCFVTRARRTAEGAQLIIVNHHLFFSDLALRARYPGARVLPDYDAVVFDEAHGLEAVATEHFGVAVSAPRIRRLTRDAATVLPSHHGLLLRTAQQRADELFALVQRRLGRGGERRLPLPEDFFAEPATQRAWFALDTSLADLAERATEQAQGEVDDHRADALADLAGRARAVQDELATLAERARDNHVHWTEVRGQNLFLRASPIEVGPLLRRHLLDQQRSVILTSATLATGGQFTYVRRRLGLSGDDAHELVLASPFDFARQAILYVPDDLPDPRAATFTAHCCQRVVELLAITGGRAFVLFTSHRARAAAVATLRNQLPYPVLVQGDEPRGQLLDRFRATDRAVLFATGAFWEGVDVPGEALSMVIIDKLPFAPPDDPLVSGRMHRYEQEGGDPFADHQIPQAALVLKQGVGRLIRRRDDRGIVAILDHRLRTRAYGRCFRQMLPSELPECARLADLRSWWQERQ